MDQPLRLKLRHSGVSRTVEAGLGARIAVVGRIGAGKSTLLQRIAGLDPATCEGSDGLTVFQGSQFKAGRRATIQSLTSARLKGAGQPKRDLAAEAMEALGLWAMRADAISELPASTVSALRILDGILSGASMLIFDEDFDRLDPVSLANTMEFWDRLAGTSRLLLFATHSAAAAMKSTHVLALAAGETIFWGSPETLVQEARDDQFEVYAVPNEASLNLVEPFAVDVQADGDSVQRFSARDGQEAAAKLLVEGYGGMAFFVRRRPTFEEALIRLLSRPGPAARSTGSSDQ